MNISQLFWQASPEELEKGYVELQDFYVCLLCGRKVDKEDDTESEESMQVHVKNSHGFEFEYLVHLEKLKQAVNRFKPGQIYSEKEVNEVVKQDYEDYVTLRRYLVDSKLMERKPDGSQYWLREK